MRPFKNRVFQRRLIGERLKEAILCKNYTYYEVAEMIGVSSANISNTINGKTDPCVDTLYCLAKELGVSTDWLLGLTDYPYRSM